MFALSEVLDKLRSEGLCPTVMKIHYAITIGKVSRPPMGSDHRYRFGEQHLAELREYLRNRERTKGLAKAPA